MSSFFLRVKIPYPLQWGRPSFHASDAFAMIAASYVAIVEVLINIPAHILGLQTDDLAERLGSLCLIFVRRQVHSLLLQDLVVRPIYLPRCLAVASDGRA